MRTQTGKKIKFKPSLIATIMEQNLYTKQDLTYIEEICKELGIKTSRGELYKTFVMKIEISPVHTPAIRIAEDYYRVKLRMARAFRKKHGLPPNR